jgi:phosphate/sulfate permease
VQLVEAVVVCSAPSQVRLELLCQTSAAAQVAWRARVPVATSGATVSTAVGKSTKNFSYVPEWRAITTIAQWATGQGEQSAAIKQNTQQGAAHVASRHVASRHVASRKSSGVYGSYQSNADTALTWGLTERTAQAWSESLDWQIARNDHQILICCGLGLNILSPA